MSASERSTPNVFQEEMKISKNSDIPCSQEAFSPTRRSSRLRKTRANGPCTSEPVDSILYRTLTRSSGSALNNRGACSDDKAPKPRQSSETNSSCFRLENEEEEESLEAMFEDIYEKKYSKSLQSMLPKRAISDTVKERKFFKRSLVESTKVNHSTPLCSKTNLPVEDVSKVFKIISKPSSVLSDAKTNVKTTEKPALKTYSNKRRSFRKTDVIESFALPDSPIAPEPVLDKELDSATMQEVNDITILDFEYTTEPWLITTTEAAEIFPALQEIRKKSEPELFNGNGSNDIFDCFLDFKLASLNDKFTGNGMKPVPINFTKILALNDGPKRNWGGNSDTLVIGDKEFEFSNSSLVPKTEGTNERRTLKLSKRKLSVSKRTLRNVERQATVRKRRIRIRNHNEDSVPKTSLTTNACDAVEKTPERLEESPKRLLRSSYSNTRKNTPCNNIENENDEHNLTNVATQRPKGGNNRKTSRSNSLVLAPVTKADRRILRSSSQNSVLEYKHSDGQNRTASTSSIKVALEKCNVTGVDGVDKRKRLRRSKRAVRQIKVVLKPLDVSRMSETTPEREKEAGYNVVNRKKRGRKPKKSQEFCNNECEKSLEGDEDLTLKQIQENCSSHSLDQSQIVEGNSCVKETGGNDPELEVGNSDNASVDEGCGKGATSVSCESETVVGTVDSSTVEEEKVDTEAPVIDETSVDCTQIEEKQDACGEQSLDFCDGDASYAATEASYAPGDDSEGVTSKQIEEESTESNDSTNNKDQVRVSEERNSGKEPEGNAEVLAINQSSLEFKVTAVEVSYAEAAVALSQSDAVTGIVDAVDSLVVEAKDPVEAENEVSHIGDKAESTAVNDSIDELEQNAEEVEQNDGTSPEVPTVSTIAEPQPTESVTSTETEPISEDVSRENVEIADNEGTIDLQLIRDQFVDEDDWKIVDSVADAQVKVNEVQSSEDGTVDLLEKEASSSIPKESTSKLKDDAVLEIQYGDSVPSLESEDNLLDKLQSVATQPVDVEALNEAEVAEKEQICNGEPGTGPVSAELDVAEAKMLDVVPEPSLDIPLEANKEAVPSEIVPTDVVTSQENSTTPPAVVSNGLECVKIFQNGFKKLNDTTSRSLEAAEKQPDFYKRLKEKRRKLLGNKLLSIGELVQSNTSILLSLTKNNVKPAVNLTHLLLSKDQCDSFGLEMLENNQQIPSEGTGRDNKIKENKQQVSMDALNQEEVKIAEVTIPDIQNSINLTHSLTSRRLEETDLLSECESVDLDDVPAQTVTQSVPVKKKRGRKKQQDVTPKAQEAVPTLSDFVVDNRVSETVTLPLVTKRSRGRPRKINNEEVSKAPVEAVIVKQAPNAERKRGHSGRGRRRESVDDMDLLKRYNRHYKEQLKRSKSITRTMQEIKRKPYHWVPHEDNTRVLDRYRKLCRKRAGSPAWDTEDEDGAWDTRTRLGRARSQARDTEDEDDAWYKRNRLSRARSQIRDMEDEDEEAWNKRTRLGRARSQARDTEDEDESLWEKRRRSSRGHSQTRDTEDEYEDVAWEKRTRSRSQARDTEDEDISLEKRTRLRRASSQARDSEDENNAEAKDELNIPNQSESATSKSVAQIADVEVKEMRLGRAGSQARDTEDEDESFWEKRRRSSRGHSQARDTEDEDVAREKKTRLRRACSQPRESENENNAKIRRGSPQARDTIINELNISNQSVSATSKSVEQIVDVQNKEAKEMRSDGNTDVDDERIRCVKNFEDCLAGRSSFNVGDIVWGQIGTYPFWPCMIMKDPGTSLHKKKFRGKYCQREMYHVRFFGDRGRRAWINKQQIMLYSSRRDLDVLEDLMKSEHKPASYMYVVKGNAVKKWKCAVDEAEQLKLKDFNEKISFFDELFRKTTSSQPKERKDDKLQKEASSKSNSPKQKPVIEHVTGDSALEIASSESTRRSSDGQVEEKTEWSPGIGETSSKKCKLFMSGDASFCEELSISVQDPNSTLKSEDIPQTSLEKKQSDEISEIGSKASSDNATISDMPLNTMEAQKALYKRNNLFRGVSREKVCQYCFKPGEVLKCRGKCNGSYHVTCSLKILQERTPRRGGPKKSKKKRFVIKNENSFNESSALNESLPIVISPKKPCRDMAEEEQVQIITVPSSVYNTPPRKTFPPNFKHMTLAEQIDYKMKEIMKKFESKTVYSVVETIPDATSRVQPLTNITDTDAEKQIPPPEISTRINNELVNTGRLSGGKPKPSSKKRLFFKHVTADSIVELDDIKVEDEEKELYRKHFKCGFCVSDLYPFCFVCHRAVSKKGSSIRQKCSVYPCGRFYHPDCLKMWPQTQWSLIQTTRHKDSDIDMDSFVCPLHVCHTCVSDDPRAATSRCSGGKIVKCLRCPSTYHSSNLCIPAGTAILSSSQILCPRHRDDKHTINTTWCFICSEGGHLICCETCPTSVHPECLPVNLTDDDKFICEDCESGRLPLYDEIVWVKLGWFRWWPAVILFPNEVPPNIRNRKHGTGEFVVKFFGTYDYNWVTRGRSFLFQEGDTSQCNTVKKKNKVDVAFNTAVEEAVVAHKLKKEFKLSQEVESVSSLKPPPYIRIKVNKPVGNVRHLDLDLSSTNACECDPHKPHPCGPESDCLNRLLLTECDPDVCPAGSRCKNQSFEKREYPPLMPYKTQGRGWGLKTLAPIKKGQFVIEYVGELIDSEEYQRRIQKMHKQKEENYYFLTIDKDRMIDAGPKGNQARFMNHCCQPNCETQKWTVNGDTRVGLFATQDIPVGTELTFNYNLECVGKEKKVCRCGAPNCSGFIGVKAKQKSESRKRKRTAKIRKPKPAEPVVLPPCFICGKGEAVICCNNKVCNKAYHQTCLSTMEQTEGNKFICPWHNCNVCSKRTIRCCVKCINSYCPSHSDANIRYDHLLGFVCTSHDPTIPSNGVQSTKSKRRRNEGALDDSRITSTTSSDDDDWMPLSLRLKRLNMRRSLLCDSDSDNDSVTRCSVKAPYFFSDREEDSQDETTADSATDVEEEVVVVKRRRARHHLDKKLRLANEPNITARPCIINDSLGNSSNSDLSSRHIDLQDR